MVRKNLSDLLKEEAQKSSQPQEVTVDAQVVPESEDDSTGDRRRSNPTKADLETTVKELTAALEAAQTENSSLRSQLQDQTTLVDKVQKEQKTLVEKVEKLQAELDQAKQTILKLTETNSKPSKPDNSKQSKLSSPPSAIIRSPQPNFQPDLPSTAFTDKDIGWVD